MPYKHCGGMKTIKVSNIINSAELQYLSSMRPHRKWVAKSRVIKYWTSSDVSIWIDDQRVEGFWLAGFRYNVIIVTVLR